MGEGGEGYNNVDQRISPETFEYNFKICFGFYHIYVKAVKYTETITSFLFIYFKVAFFES